AADDADERGLAGAVGPQQSEDLAAVHLEVDVPERGEARSVGLAESLDRYDGRQAVVPGAPSEARAVEVGDVQFREIDVVDAAQVDRHHRFAVRPGPFAEGRAPAVPAALVAYGALAEGVDGKFLARRFQVETVRAGEGEKVALAPADGAVAFHGLGRLVIEPECDLAAVTASLEGHGSSPCSCTRQSCRGRSTYRLGPPSQAGSRACGAAAEPFLRAPRQRTAPSTLHAATTPHSTGARAAGLPGR